MWTAILGAIPWSAIFNLAIQLILFIITKSADHKKAEEEFLKFISMIQKDIPVKLKAEHEEQIKRILAELEKK